MSFRFSRRIRLAPGVTLNLSKSTASLSLGPQGAKYTVGPRGSRFTLGLPGTGLFYTVHGKRGDADAGRSRPGFLRRLVAPPEERAFTDAMEALDRGDEEAALAGFERASGLPDALWMAGMLHLGRQEFEPARQRLEAALAESPRLGEAFGKYGIDADAVLPVTPEIDAHMRPCERSTRLALAEIAQGRQRPREALAHLERLLALEPQDPVAMLSLAELVLAQGDEPGVAERIVALTAEVGNDSPVHAALLLYRARALAALGRTQAAVDVLTAALRRRKDRPETLLRQLRHDRAALYQAQGRHAQAQRDFERLGAEAQSATAPVRPGAAG